MNFQKGGKRPAYYAFGPSPGFSGSADSPPPHGFGQSPNRLRISWRICSCCSGVNEAHRSLINTAA
jgi:hypothetical protein